MGRTIKDFSFNGNTDGLFGEIHNYLISEGYEYLVFEGEQVFKKGHGLATGPTFIKVSSSGGIVRLEAWMKYAVLPGVYASEIDLDSFVGSAVKGPVRKRFAWIEQLLLQRGAQLLQQGYFQQPYAPAQPQYQQPQYQQPYAPVQQEAPVFCMKCGERFQDGAVFCMKCGNKRQ